MSYAYSAIRPLHKEAALPIGAIGRSLWNRGVWGTLAHGGQKLADGGGRLARAGGHLATGAGVMQKASPWLTAYGITGMVADPLGYNLPGSSLALGIGAPGWGAAYAAPSLIQTGRLATGKYNRAIEDDTRLGAQLAGQDWMDATMEHAPSAYDPNEYVRYLTAIGADTKSPERYLNGRGIERPGAWRRVGNMFENPTGNVTPEVQSRIYDRMFKGAAYTELEKSAGGNPKGIIKSLWGAPGRFLERHPTAWKNTKRLGTTAMVAMPAIGTYDAITSDKPYDEVAIRQEGYDGAQAAIRDRLSKMTPFQRQMARMDPSLAVNAMEQALPGTVAGWEQSRGRPYQHGPLGGMQQVWNSTIAPSIQQAWGSRGTPKFYTTTESGNQQYIS